MTAYADIGPRLRFLWLLFSLLASPAVAQESDVPIAAVPVAEAQDAALPPAQPPAAAAANYRYWTTDWSFQDVDVRQLTERLASIGIALPVEVAGDVSLQFRVSIPLNGLKQPRAYRFEGSLASKQLRLDQLQLSDFRAVVRYDDGVLQLQSLQTQWQGDQPQDGDSNPVNGSVRGSARAELVPRGELSADLELQHTAVDPLVQLLQGFGVVPAETSVRGQLTGNAKLRCQIAGLQQPENWQLDAHVRSPNLQFNETSPLSIDSGPVTQRDGQFSMPAMAIQFADNPSIQVTGSIAHQWFGKQPFEFQLQANDVPTEQVAAMIGQGESPVTGKLDLRLHASGQQQPPQWNIVAQIGSPGVSLLGVDLGLIEHELRCDQSTLRLHPIRAAADADGKPSQHRSGMRLGNVSADYRLQPSAFELTALQAQLFGGQIDGKATIALGNQNPQAEHLVELRWDQIRLPLPLPQYGWLNGTIVADSSGTIDWRVPAAAWQRPLEHRGTATLVLNHLQIADADIGNAAIQLTADGQSIDLKGKGELFGGSFQVSADSVLKNQTTWSDVFKDAWQADMSIQAADLSNLSRVSRSRLSDRINGDLTATVAIRSTPRLRDAARQSVDNVANQPSGYRSDETRTGTLQYDAQVLLQNVVYQDRNLTPQLKVDLRGDESGVWLDRVEGRFAGGTLSGSGDWSFGSGRRQFSLRASSIDLPTVVAPFGRDAARHVGGYVSATATITKADSYQIKGAAQWHDGRMIEIPVASGNTGFHAQLSNNFRSWQADLNRIQLRTGRGQWTGDLQLASTTDRQGLQMASQWKAHRVDFTDLFPTRGGPVSLGATRATGNLTLGGRAIRSLADLQGRFDVQLDGTEARAVPGLPSTQNYLGAVSLSSIRFDEGRMRGTIGGGAVGLTEFWLLDQKLRVYADGKIRLADGRMDVNAVLNTGDFSSQNLLLRQLAVTAGAGVAPLSVLVQANELLSNRTLILDLTGPVGNPRVRLKTVDTLRANATEFFLQQARQAAGVLVVGAVWPD